MLTRRRMLLIFLVAAIASTVAILILKYWGASFAQLGFSLPNFGLQQSSSAPESTRNISSSGAENLGSVGTPAPTVARTNNPLPGNNSDPASGQNSKLFGESLRLLLSSNRITKTDYAMLRINIPCGGSVTTSSVAKQQLAETMAAEKKDVNNSANLAIGSASYQQRLASIDRFNELCKKILNGGMLAGEEYKSVSTSPNVLHWRTIAREASAEKLNLSNLQTKSALETVVTTPMYGALEGILYNKLDYGALRNFYSEDQTASLQSLVVPILLCRLGDDCGPDGFLTLQICRNNGICGNDVEGAIWDHLRSRQFNTEPLREFVDQRFRALSVLDFSILKNQK